MAKGGKGYSGGSSFGKSSTSSFRIAPTFTPKIHNNIFSTRSGSEGFNESQYKSSSSPKKVENILKPTLIVPSSSTKSSSPITTPSSSGFLSNMADGFSFGVGSSVARNIVDRIFSTSSSTIITSNKPNIIYKQCEELEKSWSECMNLHNQDVNICKKAFEDYEVCKRNM